MQFQVLFVFLSTVLAPLVKKVLVALGIGAISYVGINFAMDAAKAQIMSNMAGIPLDVAQLMGLFKFDVAINIAMSAVTTRMAFSGVNKITGTKKSLGSVGG